MTTEPMAYLNGTIVPVSQAQLHVFDLGVVGGASVTEMIRTFQHEPFRLDDHLRRLAESLHSVGLEIGLPMTELKSICNQLVSDNAKLIPPHHDLGLIVFVTAGINPTYVGRTRKAGSTGPTVCVHTFPLPFELWADKYETGLNLVMVSTRSIPDDVIKATIKHRSRLHWHIADREAKRIDPTGMAVLTDHNGNLTETASGNVWWVNGGDLMTPSANILKGISRQVVLELGESLNFNRLVDRFHWTELLAADEAFVSSTPTCLQPVTQFNGKPVGTGRPGPMFRQLIGKWSEMVGVNIIEQMTVGARDRLAAASG